MPAGILSQTPANDLSLNEIEKLTLLCDSTSLPGMVFDLRQYRIYGPSYQRPTHVSFGDTVTMGFLVLQDQKPRRIFESWMNMIIDQDSHNFNYPEEYLSSGIKISLLKHMGKGAGPEDYKTHSVLLIDAFPTDIQSMNLDYGSKELQRLVVTLILS